jgi:hypothetical protein
MVLWGEGAKATKSNGLLYCVLSHQLTVKVKLPPGAALHGAQETDMLVTVDQAGRAEKAKAIQRSSFNDLTDLSIVSRQADSG